MVEADPKSVQFYVKNGLQETANVVERFFRKHSSKLDVTREQNDGMSGWRMEGRGWGTVTLGL